MGTSLKHITLTIKVNKYIKGYLCQASVTLYCNDKTYDKWYLPGEEDSWLEHDVHLSELPVEVAGLLAALAARAPAQNQDEFYSFLSQGSHSVHLNLFGI